MATEPTTRVASPHPGMNPPLFCDPMTTMSVLSAKSARTSTGWPHRTTVSITRCGMRVTELGGHLAQGRGGALLQDAGGASGEVALVSLGYCQLLTINVDACRAAASATANSTAAVPDRASYPTTIRCRSGSAIALTTHTAAFVRIASWPVTDEVKWSRQPP